MRRRDLLAAGGTLAGGLAGCTFTQPPTGSVVLDNRLERRLSITVVVERFGDPGGDCTGRADRRRVVTASIGRNREGVLTRLRGPGTYRVTVRTQSGSDEEAVACLSYRGDQRQYVVRADGDGLHFVEE